MPQEEKRPGEEGNGTPGRLPELPAAPELPDVPQLRPASREASTPELPATPHVPHAPKLAPVVRSQRTASGLQPTEPGSYNKTAMAATLAGSFTTPIIVLTLGGYWLDQKLHHPTPYLTLVGMLVGLIAGVSAVMRIFRKLSD